MIVVVDFGSQTAHLIARRIKDLGVEVKIIHPERSLSARLHDDKKIKGIILSGGPSSVYTKNAPTINPKVFSFNIPIFGICYGLQLMAKLLGGEVVPGRKEYGPTELELGIRNYELGITDGLPNEFRVWMSHGDEVMKLPKGFDSIGSTESIKHAFVGNMDKNIYGVQFHPEVEHTEYGSELLQNFINICHPELARPERGRRVSEFQLNLKSQISNLKTAIQNSKFKNVEEIEQKIKNTVGDKFVIGAVSGGVDSTVAAALTAKAIGEQFIPIFVDNGLMREGTSEYVKRIFSKLGVRPLIINVEKEMLKRLKGIIDPEKKRKIIGNFYIEIFEKEMERLIKKGKDVQFLLQGTIYSDVIESKGTKHASKIKSHHNVGGLPKNMKLKLIEPLREFYKDEVRLIGDLLGLPDEFIYKQPFPGPGFAVRIRGEVTKKRLETVKKADLIVLEELEKATILSKVFQSFPVLTNSYSTAVKGDGRFFGEVIAIRIVETSDIMTANWSKVPYEILQKISSRIVNEIHGISRVVYDITTKPPATMEWE